MAAGSGTEQILQSRRTFCSKAALVALLGALAGIGLFTLKVANFFSYFSDDPRTCLNCHVMRSEYATWFHGSHSRLARCNECHVPQDNLLRHYAFKAVDGLRHAVIFTLRQEPQAISMRPAGRRVVADNCFRCHTALFTEAVRIGESPWWHSAHAGRDCWQCHRDTPHGRVRSLSAVPAALLPNPGSMMPVWGEKSKEQRP
jgi:cytochrome c nitrite reductase small subunit